MSKGNFNYLIEMFDCQNELLQNQIKLFICFLIDGDIQMSLPFKNVCISFSVVYRYGGISVGGQLPVLELQPQTIKDVATQMGQLLNVTGVRSQN